MTAEERYAEKIVFANRTLSDFAKREEFTNFLEEPDSFLQILNMFYQANKPDVYKMHISTEANMTSITIQHSILKSTSVHTVNDNITVCLLLAVSEFINYQGQEFRPV